MTAIGIHVESLDQEVRERWTPGKATVPLEDYEAAWAEAVRVFGANRVSTFLLIGLGENPDVLVKGAECLIAMGVYPFVVPYRPLKGALAYADGRACAEPRGRGRRDRSRGTSAAQRRDARQRPDRGLRCLWRVLGAGRGGRVMARCATS